ncbi:hypothetical protein GCM10010423_29520 [Streptomyces levis]|uniref:Uncharacterized protein n=1 Tax=Streptomyces levis TaxID=285566 RepID=A0ABN3NR67_9ACTN
MNRSTDGISSNVGHEGVDLERPTGKARKQPFFIHPEEDQVMALLHAPGAAAQVLGGGGVLGDQDDVALGLPAVPLYFEVGAGREGRAHMRKRRLPARPARPAVFQKWRILTLHARPFHPPPRTRSASSPQGRPAPPLQHPPRHAGCA